MPRRRTNQCDASAISGAKVADEPRPISTCTTRELPQRGRKARADIAGKQRGDADGDRRHDPQPVATAGR